jgi:hypothetical protein
MSHGSIAWSFICRTAENKAGFICHSARLTLLRLIAALILIFQSGLATASSFATTSWASGPAPGTVSNECLVGDFNGDGKSDIACYSGGGTWTVALSNGSGFSSTTGWTSGVAPSTPISNQCFAGDYNGDGRTDIACYNNSGGWAVALSTGSGFNSFTWAASTTTIPVTDHCMTGDFNGDGKTDIICYNTSSVNWSVALSTGSGFNNVIWTGGYGVGSPLPDFCFTGDLNGDGLTDFVCNGGTVWNVSFSTGTGFAPPQVWSTMYMPYVPVTDACTTGDFNGDGLTDIICTFGAGYWDVMLSTGTAFNETNWNGAVSPGFPITNQCFAGGVAGSGLTDLTCYSGGGTSWGVSPSSGTGFPGVTWSGPSTSSFNTKCLEGDFNGDGEIDIACYTSSGNWDVGIAMP